MRRALSAYPSTACLLLAVSALSTTGVATQSPGAEQKTVLMPMVEGEW